MLVNRVQLKGNIGTEPVEHTFANGGSIVTFKFATTIKGYKTKEGREIPDKTDWHNIVCKNRFASVATKYFKKGMRLDIEGEIHYRSYDKDGATFWITEIFMTDFAFGDSKPSKQDEAKQDTQQPPWDNAQPQEMDIPF